MPGERSHGHCCSVGENKTLTAQEEHHDSNQTVKIENMKPGAHPHDDAEYHLDGDNRAENLFAFVFFQDKVVELACRDESCCNQSEYPTIRLLADSMNFHEYKRRPCQVREESG